MLGFHFRKRVVAVFVQGPEWQFKDWKKYKEFQTVPDILSKVCGFHIMYEDEMVDQKVKQWRCKVLKLSKHKRHLDGPASSLFWQILYDWFKSRNIPHLAY